MIIKRKLKSEMPILKRRRIGNSVDDESASGKKKKNGNYPLSLLAGVIPASIPGLLGTTTVSPPSGGDGDCGDCRDGGDVKAAAAATRRTSRGRVQVLPSRFKDSVIENWRKESRTVSVSESENELELEEFSFKNCVGNGKSAEKRPRGYSVLCEEVLHKNFGAAASKGVSLSEEFGELKKGNKGILKVEEEVKKKEGLYGVEDFYAGDIVWAKVKKVEPFWPAIVIDPRSQAPELVLRSCIADAVCVMFLGSTGKENCKEYGWVKSGMIFPFVDYAERFQGQSDLGESNRSQFQMAIEEAFLADQGFVEHLIADINAAAGKTGCSNSILNDFKKVTSSKQNAVRHVLKQELFDKNGLQLCEECGLNLPFNTSKKTRDLTPGGQLLCKACARLTKSEHYCGICKKIWNHSDSGSWVCCDGCKMWVHAECDKISSNLFKNLGCTDYLCPTCKVKVNFELSDTEKSHPKVKCNTNNHGQLVLPKTVRVLCNGVEGIYIPTLHLVVCKCGLCETKKRELSEWERHTGAKFRNWRLSIQVKGSSLSLADWMMQLEGFHADAAVSVKPRKPSLKERKQRLITYISARKVRTCLC